MAVLTLNGPYSEVMAELGRQGGDVFGPIAGRVLPQVAEAITNSARGHQWDTVLVTVSNGLSPGLIEEYTRLEGEGLIQGPVIISPDGGKNEEEYGSSLALQAKKDRLSHISREAANVSYIITGTDKIDASLVNRLRESNVTMAANDGERLARQLGDAEPEFSPDQNAEQVAETALLRQGLRMDGDPVVRPESGDLTARSENENQDMHSGENTEGESGQKSDKKMELPNPFEPLEKYVEEMEKDSKTDSENTPPVSSTDYAAMEEHEPSRSDELHATLDATRHSMPATADAEAQSHLRELEYAANHVHNDREAVELEREAIDLRETQERKSTTAKPERPEETPVATPDATSLPAPENKPK